AVAGPADEDGVEVALADRAVEVGVEEVQAGCRPPVPEQARLHVLRPQRLAQERIVGQVDLPDREGVGGAPVRGQHTQLVVGHENPFRWTSWSSMPAPRASSFTSSTGTNPVPWTTSSRRMRSATASSTAADASIGLYSSTTRSSTRSTSC